MDNICSQLKKIDEYTEAYVNIPRLQMLCDIIIDVIHYIQEKRKEYIEQLMNESNILEQAHLRSRIDELNAIMSIITKDENNAESKEEKKE